VTEPPSSLAFKLRARIRQFAALNGISALLWRGGEILAGGLAGPGFIGSGFLLSGIGFALWIVSLIIVVAAAMQAKAAGAFDILRDDWARPIHAFAFKAMLYTGAACAFFLTAAMMSGTAIGPFISFSVAACAAGFLFAWAWKSRL